MKIKIGDNKYNLYEEVDANFPFCDIINRGLYISKTSIAKCNFNTSKIDDINLKIYAYDDENVNAFALKENEKYIIGISFGLFIETENWIQHWFNLPEFDLTIEFDDKKSKKIFFYNIFYMSIFFVIMHEYYHILDGHCDFPIIENNFIDEYNINYKLYNDSPDILFDNLLSQIFEYDADFGAINACISSIMQQNCSGEQKKSYLAALILGVYNIFLLFNDINNSDFDKFIIKDFRKYNHPPAGIRITYCIIFISYLLQNYWQDEKIYNTIGAILNQCVYFDKLLMKSIKFKQCLFSITYTHKGIQHIMLLNNLWGDIREELKKYAYIELRDCEEIESMIYFVDDNGDFLTD